MLPASDNMYKSVAVVAVVAQAVALRTAPEVPRAA